MAEREYGGAIAPPERRMDLHLEERQKGERERVYESSIRKPSFCLPKVYDLKLRL